jgi:hypothetical protein
VSFITRFQETVAAAKAFERSNGAAPPSRVTPPAPRLAGVHAGELLRRRERLRRELAELQWDLGGLAYEMAIRDHFRMDVLLRRAARLQEVDAELANVERLLVLDDAGAAGRCPSCRALYARGAVFCAHCGTRLMETVSVPAGE